MFLLSHNGTILRRDEAGGALIHALPWPIREGAEDWDAAPAIAAGGVQTIPSPQRGVIYLQRDGMFLCADPHAGTADFARQAAGAWELFLPLSATALAAMRALCGGEFAAPGQAPAHATLHPGFMLEIAGNFFNLADGVPDAAEAGLVAARPAPDEIALPLHAQAETITDPAALRSAANTILPLAEGEVQYFLPLSAGPEDAAWMLQHCADGAAAPGRYPAAFRLRRATAQIALSLQGHGLALVGIAGFTEGAAALKPALPVTATGPVTREGTRFFADRAALSAAQRLQGPHIVLPGLTTATPEAWLTHGLIPLATLAHLVPDATLLAPACLSEAPALLAQLPAWGLGGLRRVDMPSPCVRLDEALWAEPTLLAAIPAAILRDIAARIPALRADEAAPRRLYLRRNSHARVENAAQIESLLANHGFTPVAPETCTPEALIALFRAANFIAAPQDPALLNILFCRPGTKILEFSPRSSFDPVHARLSDRLGLLHAVLPAMAGAPTNSPSPQSLAGPASGVMRIDPARLRAALRQLMAAIP